MSQTFIPEDEVVNLSNLISVIKDPDKFAKALDQLQTIDARVAKRKAEMQDAAKVANDAQVALDKKNKEIEKIKAEADQVKSVSEREMQRVKDATALLAAKSDDLDEQHEALTKRAAFIAQKEQEVKQLDLAAQQKHSIATSTLEDAKKTQAVLQAKLAKLKELAG